MIDHMSQPPVLTITYTSPHGAGRIEVRVSEGSVWLSQKIMGEMYGVSVKTVNEHLQNIFKAGEVSQNTVVRKNRITAKDGKSYLTMCYSLEAILAVGYRIKPGLATKFRLWAERSINEVSKQSLATPVDDDLTYSQEETVVEEYVEL